LLFAVKMADNRFIGIEHLTEQELDLILREVGARGVSVQSGHSARPIRHRVATVSGREEPSAAGPSRGPQRPRKAGI